MRHLVTTATHPETDERLEVEAEYWPARRGGWQDGYQTEPDEPAEVVILAAYDEAGDAIELRGIEDRLIDQILRQRP